MRVIPWRHHAIRLSAISSAASWAVPFKKDKLFFFLGYQGTLIRSNPSQASVLSPRRKC